MNRRLATTHIVQRINAAHELPATHQHPHYVVALAICLSWLAIGCAARSHAPHSTQPSGLARASNLSPTAPVDAALASLAVDAYRVRLEIDPSEMHFRGDIEISAQITNVGNTFALHGDGLELDNPTLIVNGRAFPLRQIAPSPGDVVSTLRLQLDARASISEARLRDQTIILRVGFRGTYRRDDGLFVRRAGNDVFVFSDLEPRFARHVFPCIDEPLVKVPWTIELDVPPGMQAYSNAAQRSRTRLPSGRDRVAFATTAPLPSYLVAIAVGPLVEVPVPNAPVPTRFLLPRDHADKAAAAVRVLPTIMRAAEKFVGMPLPYAKHDFVGIPDFGGNAMENPGLITFDVMALAGTRDGTEPRREPISQYLAIVLAHELAHLWFGDLATLRDWRDLWFQEGFATYVSYRVLDAVFPAWNIGRDEIEARRVAEITDQLVGAQPVRPPSVATPELLFTPMTYIKGGAIIETIAAAIGHATFMKAMRDVLLAHEHRNVGGDDILLAMARALPLAFGDEGTRLAMVTELFETNGLTEIAISTRCAAANDNAVVVETSKRVVARFPLCLRIGDATGSTRTCFALAERHEIPTKGCAHYALPANGEGYLHFTLAPQLRQTTLLMASELTPREQFIVTRTTH